MTWTDAFFGAVLWWLRNIGLLFLASIALTMLRKKRGKRGFTSGVERLWVSVQVAAIWWVGLVLVTPDVEIPPADQVLAMIPTMWVVLWWDEALDKGGKMRSEG